MEEVIEFFLYGCHEDVGIRVFKFGGHGNLFDHLLLRCDNALFKDYIHVLFHGY